MIVATCPIEPIVEDGDGMTILQLCRTGIFWLFILLMIFSGASEIAMAQWASAFAESSLGVSKMVGDFLWASCGPALLALLLVICTGVLKTKNNKK